jgi:hypothetical protein
MSYDIKNAIQLVQLLAGVGTLALGKIVRNDCTYSIPYLFKSQNPNLDPSVDIPTRRTSPCPQKPLCTVWIAKNP